MKYDYISNDIINQYITKCENNVVIGIGCKRGKGRLSIMTRFIDEASDNKRLPTKHDDYTEHIGVILTDSVEEEIKDIMAHNKCEKYIESGVNIRFIHTDDSDMKSVSEAIDYIIHSKATEDNNECKVIIIDMIIIGNQISSPPIELIEKSKEYNIPIIVGYQLPFSYYSDYEIFEWR